MKTLLFIGDSITDSHRLFLDVPHNLGDGFVWKIRQRLSETDFSIINRGHDGFTVKDLLHHAGSDSLAFDADIITILVGVNDIAAQLYGEYNSIPDKFYKTYHTLLKKISSARPKAKLILMEPFTFSRPSELLHFHPLIQKESECIRALAKEYHAVFIPLHKTMNEQNDAAGASKLTTDGIHLSEAGSELLAECWLSAASKLLF